MSDTQSNKYFFFRNLGEISNRGADVHYHSYFEIYRLTAGGCDSFVDDKLYNMRPGDVVIIPPGIIHGTHYTTEKHGRTLINFTSHYLPKEVGALLKKAPCFYRCEETREETDRIFSKIEKEYYEGDSFSDEAICALLAELVIMMVRHSQNGTEIIAQDSLIENAVTYIQENYKNQIALSDIAASCYVSKVHLSRKFKDKTGIGVNEYVTLYRLKKAKELLLTRDRLSICEIAFDCGFNDSNYFSWLFKKKYGVTPTQYRKNTSV